MYDLLCLNTMTSDVGVSIPALKLYIRSLFSANTLLAILRRARSLLSLLAGHEKAVLTKDGRRVMKRIYYTYTFKVDL